ncbi:MAG: DegT/DnrJ/EryC1/StrS family aminotransferase, partial [Bacteroides sp.]
DTLQAALLRVKLRHLDVFLAKRTEIAEDYTRSLSDLPGILLPTTPEGRTYHQYTLRVLDEKRDALKEYLKARHIATMVYYPTPLCDQPAFAPYARCVGNLSVARALAQEVLSLPLPPRAEDRARVAEAIHDFFSYHA